MQNEELRRAQVELDALRARYFDFFDLAPVGYVILSEKGLILEANLTTATLLGVARSALAKQPLTNFILPEDQDIYYLHRKKLFETRARQVCGFRMRRGDSQLWVRVESATAKDAEGAPVCRTVLSDITERKRMEDALFLSDARYFSILENQAELICRYLPDGRLSFVNEAYARYYGKAREDLLNHNYIPCIPEPDISMVIEQIKGITPEKPTVEFEHRVIMPDGAVRWQRWNHCGIFTRQAKIKEYQAVGRDITDRKRVEEELLRAKAAAEEANRAKSQFLAHMSHELRSPLNPVIGFSELLAEAPNLTDEQRQWLGIVRQRGNDLLTLISEILDFSKIEAGKAILDQRPMSLRRMMEDMRSSIEPAAAKKGLELESHVAVELPDAIRADGPRLRQILLNLLTNAIKFTPSGRIFMRVEDGATCIRRPLAVGETALLFSVRDTGIGIAEDKKAMIFEAFKQAAISHAVEYGGAGLGLAIVRHLVTLMGGAIWVESSEGQGSVFSFTAIVGVLPAGSVPVPVRHTREARPHKPLKILVVDDDPINNLMLEVVLKRRGDTVSSAKDGKQALSLLDAEVFDVVLMDAQMPRMSGIEATRAIRERGQRTGVRPVIIAVTARALRGDRELLLAEGMDGYVSKPVQKDKLFDAIDAAIKVRNVIIER
ncbi:MAG: PAS domain S-box protein, partial [Chitinivibrionia bacterium]|nr:PAS domain S-box protein [Chitinivibrionia bacterium]